MYLAARLLTVSLTFFVLVLPLSAADETKTPRTTDNPEIPIDQLKLKLRPLDKAELLVEADGWLKLLKAKVQEISNAEIAAKLQSEQIKKVKKAKDAAKEAKEAAEEAKKVAEKAREQGDAEAAKEAEEAAKAAEKKTSQAKKAAEEAAKAEEKAEADASTQKAKEDALKKAEEKAKQEAEEKGEEKPAEQPKKEASAADLKVAVPTEAAGADPQDPRDEKKLEETAEAAKKAAEVAEKAVETKDEVKTKILENVTELRTQRTALSERLGAVLDELEKKGGAEDRKPYDLYIAAVSGINFDTMDVTDAKTVWITIGGWLTSSEGVGWLVRIGKFIGIVLAFWILSIIVGKAVNKAVQASRRASDLLKGFLTKIARRVVFLIGLIVGIQAMGVNMGPVLAVIAGAGFVIGFALQGTLSNFASGIMILAYRPFDVGDVVDVAGISGKVASMNLVSTHVKTFDNKLMIVPNNEIWGNIITNATGTDKRRVDMVFGIGYSDDIDKAQGILEELVANHELILKDPEPVIKLHELADSSVNFICRPWAKPADYWTVYWDLTRAVKQEFDKHGVSIPFPQRDLHIYHETPAPQEPAESL